MPSCFQKPTSKKPVLQHPTNRIAKGHFPFIKTLTLRKYIVNASGSNHLNTIEITCHILNGNGDVKEN